MVWDSGHAHTGTHRDGGGEGGYSTQETQVGSHILGAGGTVTPAQWTQGQHIHKATRDHTATG
jgi:hypothetical protein